MNKFSSMELINIDGSTLEGGGQILRIALSLSALKQIPIRISNIRAGRSKPGLMVQHLKGVELLRDICNAKIKGATIGSTEVEFWPGPLKGGSYNAFIKTAGSISLLLQVSLPCVLFADSSVTLTLKGGTNAEMAPQIDFMTEVFRPNLEKFGATFDMDLIRRGYFPKGGGEVVINVTPSGPLKGIDLLEQGRIKAVYGWSYVAGTLPIRMAHGMADSASNALKTLFNKVNIERYQEDRSVAPDNGSGIILVAETTTNCFLGGSAVGKRGESPEDTGKRAADELIKALKSGACVDEHTQDQLIIFMALADKPSKIRAGEITLHTKTAIFVIELMTKVKFEIVPDGSSNIISCTGMQN